MTKNEIQDKIDNCRKELLELEQELSKIENDDFRDFEETINSMVGKCFLKKDTWNKKTYIRINAGSQVEEGTIDGAYYALMNCVVVNNGENLVEILNCARTFWDDEIDSYAEVSKEEFDKFALETYNRILCIR